MPRLPSRDQPGQRVAIGSIQVGRSAVPALTHSAVQVRGFSQEPSAQKRLSDRDTPKITSSSDTIYYITKEIGTSLYFLIDGLTDTDQVTYTWTPQPSDKKPWVQFKLPKKHPLKELVLYTVNGNLIDCDAVVNGKTYSMRNNKANKITIPLGGETADTVRINILKRKTASGIDGALLTEVQLY